LRGILGVGCFISGKTHGWGQVYGKGGRWQALSDQARRISPPGDALGLDRIAMLIAEESSIREVIAFPKNNKACDLMTDSPTQVDFKQLRELYIQMTVKEKKAEGATQN